ncbi:8036f3d8-09dc-434d-bd20-e5a878e0a6b6 [Thermothielavioides terrestris]|uniref:8036f3d8-09dc-434d-bd20-e5a878e0a6b6 n=1 Tax=Thermothielavioides terrestris TaxID=2587410 RepID=A0A3S4C616_9PEZI|nr:8036f3d8-09dc-434d-bd20-e5a878e0a6b6 [Thermothielavioides terrestris]
MMKRESGEYLIFVIGYRSEVEACSTLTSGCLNLRVSQSLTKPSPPRVTTIRPSRLMSMPPVQVLGPCASLISAAGLVKGPLPLYMTSDPSRAAATMTGLLPCGDSPHATAVILVRPAEPAALDLNTMISFWLLLLLMSHILSVLSDPAVTQRFGSVGCHVPVVISPTWPFVLFMSRRYMSPLTNSVTMAPSLDMIFACGWAVTQRKTLPECRLNSTCWIGWESVAADFLVSQGSMLLKALRVVGVMDAKSWKLTVPSREPLSMRAPAGSRAMLVTARSCVLSTISWVTGNLSASSSSSESEPSESSSLSLSLEAAFSFPCFCDTGFSTCLRVCSICAAMFASFDVLPNDVGTKPRMGSSSARTGSSIW